MVFGVAPNLSYMAVWFAATRIRALGRGQRFEAPRARVGTLNQCRLTVLRIDHMTAILFSPPPSIDFPLHPNCRTFGLIHESTVGMDVNGSRILEALCGWVARLSFVNNGIAPGILPSSSGTPAACSVAKGNENPRLRWMEVQMTRLKICSAVRRN